MRGGKRVVFVSLDDGTGPVSNVVFFHDVQEQIGSGVFQTHYMLVRGTTRRSGARGVSVTGAAAWDLLPVQREHEERGATLAEATPLRRKPGGVRRRRGKSEVFGTFDDGSDPVFSIVVSAPYGLVSEASPSRAPKPEAGPESNRGNRRVDVWGW